MSEAGGVRLVIHGRVQGVGYRAWLADEAQRRGVRGWVRNRREGTVEAFLHADAAIREALIDACRRGPLAARVREIEIAEAADAVPDGFEQRPTL
ncbi:acylphosphatase [Ancylobacter sp. 3268]|uniref:acylphosphatase n=1 Tax=Ancylobacter sp. 3268 TaxID=2817752 RepID=UPI002865BED8|nr:acylphosphatase [Ancylobacter sp. 3268]MDR6950889.1 acylphosphatase [Ancylobacter sp. 3268]